MSFEADLNAVVYDPPAPGFPHLAVLFGRDERVLTLRVVPSIEAGEAFLQAAVVELIRDADSSGDDLAASA